MSLLVDTSVWSLAFQRDHEAVVPEVHGASPCTRRRRPGFYDGPGAAGTAQGFAGPKARGQLIERFGALGFLQPDREDHVEAAVVRSPAKHVKFRLWSAC